MPRTEKYFIGPQLLADVRETIDRVAAMPDRVGAPGLPAVIGSEMPAAAGVSLRYAQTVAAWSKGTRQSVQVLDSSGTATGDTANAQNPFADIEDAKKVIVARVAGDWFLIAAEC